MQHECMIMQVVLSLVLLSLFAVVGADYTVTSLTAVATGSLQLSTAGPYADDSEYLSHDVVFIMT